MPTTYNGIGTHYYGKRKVETRENTCPHCGRESTLTSYDTRLWFVVLFLPVIPLGRKRIIDQCSVCKYHYVVDLQKWATASQLEISGALEKFRNNPTPENAIEVHKQLLGFHQTVRADEFRQKLVNDYGTNAQVQTYLGYAMVHKGRFKEARDHFENALKTRPDLPEARIGAAMGRIRDGQLDEAAGLIDFLQKPGAAQLYSLEALEMLGDAYQVKGRHSEALDIYQHLLRELPHAGQHKGFRKKVKKSEKGQRKPSILPKKKFSWKSLFQPSTPGTPGLVLTRKGLIGISAVVLVFAGIFVFQNHHIKTHRKVFVVNGFAVQQEVMVNAEKLRVGPHSVRALELPEGRHEVNFTTLKTSPIQLEIQASSYFGRWFDDAVWVINPGGTALILRNEITYAANPPPTRSTPFIGESIYQFQGITHPFTPVPETVNISGGGERVLVQLDQESAKPADLFHYLLGQKGTNEAIRYAEHVLRQDSGNLALLRTYAEVAPTLNPTQASSFLAEGLNRRPVLTEWHREYQDIVEQHFAETNLVTLYDSFLREDPTNASLLYLRGRIDESAGGKRKFFQAAVQADQNNAFGFYGLASTHMSVGEWQAAKPFLARAAELRKEDEAFRNIHDLARIATENANALAEEFRLRLKELPADLFTTQNLLQLLIAANRGEECDEVINNFQLAMDKQSPPEAIAEVAAYLTRHRLYASGQFTELEKLTSGNESIGATHSRYQALVEQGKLGEAESVKLPPEAKDYPYWSLTQGLAYHLAGNVPQAKTCFQRGVEALKKGNKDQRGAARLLMKPLPPSHEEFASVFLRPAEKAILAACIQVQFPSAAGEFSSLATKLNVERTFPYHLIRRVTQNAR